jgi:hypothetical protein
MWTFDEVVGFESSTISTHHLFCPIGLNIRGMQSTQCLLLCYLRQVTAVIRTGFEPVRISPRRITTLVYQFQHLTNQRLDGLTLSLYPDTTEKAR